MGISAFSPAVHAVNEGGRPELTNVAWDDFVVIPASLKDSGVRQPGWSSLFGTALNAWHFSWNAALPEELNFSFQLPHTWKPGTVVYPHIHVGIPVAGAGGGAENHQWDIDYMVADIEDEYPAGTTNVVSAVTDAQNDAVRHHHLLDIPVTGIDLTGYEESCVLMGRIRRLVSLGSDYQNDIALLSMDAHIEINSMGTSTRTPPWDK